MNTHTHERKFLFIDETGDPGHPSQRDSSRYFQINMISVYRSDIKSLLKHFYRFRYFTDNYKELKRYYVNETRKLLVDLLRSSVPHAEFYSFCLDKETYICNHLKISQRQKESFEPKKFRNLIFRKSLERWFKEEYPTGQIQGDIEIVIDRFIDVEQEESNLRSYLRNNYKLPPFLHITQIDSDCSEMIQIVDLVGKIVREHLLLISLIPDDLVHIYRLDIAKDN
jgi:hypothetical protein